MTDPAGRHRGGGFAQSMGASTGRGAVLVAVAIVIGFVLLWQGFSDSDPVSVDTGAGDTATDDGGDGTDGAATDGGTDTATDGGTDTATDGGTDTATDGGTDTATDGGTDTATDGGTDTATDGATTGGGTDAGVTHDPSEITVMPANASGEPGLAGTLADRLKVQNYVTDAANATAADTSRILCRPDYCTDAAVLAELFGWPLDIIQSITADDLAPVETDDTRNLDADIILIMGADGVVR